MVLVSWFLCLASCNTPEKMLCRTWRVIDVDFDAQAMNVSLQDKPLIVRNLKDSTMIVFRTNHTYTATFPQKHEQGLWNFNAHKDSLYTRNSDAGAACKINVLSKIALDLDINGSDGSKFKFVMAPVQK